jgi:kynurenine formamidase
MRNTLRFVAFSPSSDCTEMVGCCRLSELEKFNLAGAGMTPYTRRECFVRACAFAGAALALRAKAAGASPKYPRNLTKMDIDRWMTELSNWGRWGKDDQAGTINLITHAKRTRAAALVRDGVSVSMSANADIAMAPASGAAPVATQHNWEHTMKSTGVGRTDGYVIDTYSMSYHNSVTTHLDALSHFFYAGKTYNGFLSDAITSWGATKDDVMPFKDGIFTRGVLIDMPALRGVPYLGDDEALYPEDLESWEKKARLKIESGDAVFLRTGKWRRVAEKGPLTEQLPGLYASCAKWLKERDIALLGSDVVQDVRPSRVDGVNQPIHLLFLVAVGTPLIDSCNLEALSEACAQRKRWSFLFTTAPLRVPGGTGSPLNPIATF